ncbi:calcium-activated potassium channel slowpoke isoform X2 [Hydra vulgaris]|uniref:calcium-activated potassium channel slowpoke isoform X2 n=1 Tax=Hydra vulgaris TaxID=6087 RepID=UPI001F5F48F7|nr:calcium-activated potassium channel slowpoke-like isoform X2 [Hydra vulgaris]
MVCNPSKLAESRIWNYYIGISIILYIGGILLILIYRATKIFQRYARRKNIVEHKNYFKYEEDDSDVVLLEQTTYLAIVEAAGLLVSAQNLQGKILTVVSFVLNLLCVAIYISMSSDPVEHCFSYDDALWKTEIFFYLLFIIHFIIRFIAAQDKLVFWSTDLMSITDMLTIPTIFFPPVFDNQYWIGLRFFRVIYLRKLGGILQSFNVFEMGSSFEMLALIGNFLSIWLLSAGMVHLLENTGDPWSPILYSNNQTLSYFNCTYYLLVTMSTIGYGDVLCITFLGKIFTMLFIFVGLGLFASYIPAIADYASSHSKYNKMFYSTPGKKLYPDINIQTKLKQYEARASYFMGTIYSSIDAKRMQINKANAVIILCNKKCTNPNEEDAANITRVIAVKNYQERVRCIVQLLMSQNKMLLMNCPQWKSEYGDAIICINELKLGLMAQSCNALGFSTLVGNILGMRRNLIPEHIPENEQWKVAYMLGATYEIYSSYLSNSFVGMTFPQAVELCFEKLRLMLIAVQIKTKNGKEFVINPMNKKFKLNRNVIGLFLAQKLKYAERALRYCSSCHKDLINPKIMVKCRCRKNQVKSVSEADVDFNLLNIFEVGLENEIKGAYSLTEDLFPNGEKPKFDQTGTFYWCESRPFNVAKMTIEEAAAEKFKNHVVVLVLISKYVSSLELHKLVLPLRTSNTLPSMLKKIVILGDGDFLQKEWGRLANFPDVYNVPGSPFNRQDLRSISIQTADMCILLSPGNNKSENIEHQALSDKEVISLTLSLRAMKFDNLTKPLVSSSIANLKIESNLFQKSTMPIMKENVFVENDKVKIKTISELIHSANAMFLDQDDMNIYDDEHFYLTQSYACGSIFTVSVLDSLVSATYFDGCILTFLQNLVTGVVSSELDSLIAEGKPSSGSFETLDIAALRNRSRIAQFSLIDGPLSEFGQCGVFGDLFLFALRTYNMICLGLFRQRDKNQLATKSSKRYVITFPEFNFVLAPTDLVFVITQFHIVKKKVINNFSKAGSVVNIE